jgi:hypothetical protein
MTEQLPFYLRQRFAPNYDPAPNFETEQQATDGYEAAAELERL